MIKPIWTKKTNTPKMEPGNLIETKNNLYLVAISSTVYFTLINILNGQCMSCYQDQDNSTILGDSKIFEIISIWRSAEDYYRFVYENRNE